MAQRLRAEFGGEPTLQKLASSLDWTPEQTAYISDLAAMGVISLDTPLSEDGRATLEDIIPDSADPSPERLFLIQEMQELISKALSTLSPREERIVRMRFGVGVRSDHTLEEIGQQFGLTRERIRQIEASALRKLKHPSRSRALRTLLE